jgi:hypothetical protein
MPFVPQTGYFSFSSVAMAQSGEITATATLEPNSTVDFGSGPITSNGVDTLVLQFTAKNTLLWANHYVGTSARPLPTSIAILPSNNDIVVGGGNTIPVDYGCGVLSPGAFLLRLDRATGAPRWTNGFPGSGAGIFRIEGLPGDDILCSVWYDGDVKANFGGGWGKPIAARFTGAGGYVWDHFERGVNETLAIRLDGPGSVRFVGYTDLVSTPLGLYFGTLIP